MRSLFFKIFAIFWLAQSLIFVISTTLIVRHFPAQNVVGDALDSYLKHDAAAALAAYQAHGCDGFADNAGRNEPAGAALQDADNNVLCRTARAPQIGGVAPHVQDHIYSYNTGGSQGIALWFVPVKGADGGHFEYIWFEPPLVSHPQQRRRFEWWRFAFPQLPVAIGVGGVTTFVLVLLFTRPLVRLREAAREMAKGNLSVRVEESTSKLSKPQSDEFHGLVHDFNHMADRLESLVAAQRLLLRDVSHELRSPLSRLSVALELAREDAGNSLETHFSRIERETVKLNDLIGQLLTLSSMETTEPASVFKPVSLNQLCEEIFYDAEYEAQQRPCTVVFEQDAECTVRGDWELLYRAVENVVRNAIRYTEPSTQVTIRIGRTIVGAQPYASIEVSDHGPGIPKDELSQIFRPFYRLDQARSSSTGGFGVGLAITERAIRLHGGTIQAENRTGGGTSIRMLFPEEKSA